MQLSQKNKTHKTYKITEFANVVHEKISGLGLHEWQTYAAFSHGNLAVVTLSKFFSTVQERANTVSENTFWADKNVQSVFHRTSRTLSSYFKNSWQLC